MAEITKQALKVDNNSSFPNNNAGAITPAILRAFNVNMIDSMVDEIGYNVDSASWNSSISQLNAFSASAQSLTTASLLITASAVSNVITFTKGNGSTFNVTVATGSIPDISNLNQATASLQAFTQSAQVSINNLNTTTASLNTSVSNINTFTASTAISITNLNASSASQQVSIDSLNQKTGSYATTGSNTFTSANTFTSISASSFVSASQFVGDGSKITGITASIALPILDEGIPQGNAFSMNFTGSAISAIVVGGTAVVSVNVPDTGSFNSLTASFNAYTQSTNSDLNAIHQATASLQTNSASVNTSISALNTFTASQSTASLVTSITNLNTFSASALVSISNINSTTASLLVETQNLELFSASALISISNLNASSASQQISIDNLNTNSASVNTSITNINSVTASLFTSASLALVTASFDTGTRNLTFTKGNNTTFAVNIPDVSGSTGNFATTGSNVFVGNQTVTGSLFISGNINMVNGADIVTHHVRAQGSNGLELQTSAGTIIVAMGQGGGTQAGFVGALSANSFSSSTINGLGDPLAFSTSVDSRLDGLEASTSSLFTSASLALTTASVSGQTMTFTKGNGTTFDVTLPTGSGGTINTGSFATTGSNTFVADQTVSASIKVTGNVEMNQDSAAGILYPMSGSKSIRVQKQVGINRLSWVDQDNEKLLYLDIDTKNFFVSGGFSAKLQNGYAWVGQSDGRSAEIATSSFSGTTYINPTLNPYSGSLILVANTFTSSSFAHISSSANGQVNLVFKNNNNTGDTILSGSNNIFTNAAAPTTGFKRYVGGSGNIILNASNVPQISGSMAFSPTMNNNYFGGNSTTLTARGPVSASTWTISANNVLGTIALGSSATLHAEKLTGGLSMTQNSVAGTLTIVANQSALTGSNTTLTSNNINGGIQLTLSSSAATFNNNSVNDSAFFFINQFSSSSVGLGIAAANVNTISGNANTFLATGSQLTGSVNFGVAFNQNCVFGQANTLFANASDARVSGSNAYHSSFATGLLGSRLIATGSSNSSDLDSFGSVFVGRWNANDGIRNKTSDVVFAVGTGISGSGTTGRKTGFLIDSGSNTFIEGTLNVSGSTTMTGSLILSSSNAIELQVIGNSVFTGSVAGNVVSASITSNTASIDFSLGNYFEVTSSVTPLHLDVTNIGAGRTSTLIISASASSSILFSPNVAQPSGSAYSGSLGSIDIISLVAFNTSKVNLVSTKALV